MKDYEVKIFIEDKPHRIVIPRNFDVSVSKDIAIYKEPKKSPIYYMKIDKNKKKLDIHEVKNLHNLSKQTKIAWGDLNSFLNDERPIDWFSFNNITPFIKRNGDMYVISYYKEIIEDKNYDYMSRDMMDKIEWALKYSNVHVTTSKGGK